MKIAVGTKNDAKLEAVRRAMAEYPIFSGGEIIPVSTESGVSDQPKSLDETIEGAMNRAKNAYEVSSGDYGIGLESGIFKVPCTKSDYMDTTCCAIYDGKHFHLGLSSCFEYPTEMVKLAVEKGLNISQAAKELRFSEDDMLGAREGMIGILTKNRITRADYTYQAIMTAMIHLENMELYKLL